MSSGINIFLSKKRKATACDVATSDFMRDFVKKHKRQPTLREIAEHFDITAPSAWERVRRAAKNKNVCFHCGNKISAEEV